MKQFSLVPDIVLFDTVGNLLKVATNGQAARIPLLNDFLIASTYAGILSSIVLMKRNGLNN